MYYDDNAVEQYVAGRIRLEKIRDGAGDMTVLDYSIVGLTVGEVVFVATVLTLLRPIYAAILGFAIVAVSPHSGSEPQRITRRQYIAGVVIGFASQSVVANLVSGLFILWEGLIKIGDQIGAARGLVCKRAWSGWFHATSGGRTVRRRDRVPEVIDGSLS